MRGSLDIAIEQFTLAIRSGDLSSENLADAYNNRGYAYDSKGEHDRAIQDCDEAIRLNPTNAQAYGNRANAYFSNGVYDRAIQDYNEAIRLNPTNAQAYSNRANAYGRKGAYDRAIQDYNEAIRLNPNYALAYYNRGNAHGRKGAYDRAIQDYNEVIRLNPSYTLTYYNRGNAHFSKGEYDHAIQDYNEAIWQNPNYVNVYFSRAYARFYLAQFSAAQGDFKKVLDMQPINPHAAIWLYLAGARLGQDERRGLAKNAEKLEHTNLTGKIVSLYLGKLPPADLLAAAKDLDSKKERENLCEVNFYLGQYALLRNERTDALKFFRAAVETGVSSFYEYAGAKAELNRLEHNSRSTRPDPRAVISSEMNMARSRLTEPSKTNGNREKTMPTIVSWR